MQGLVLKTIVGTCYMGIELAVIEGIGVNIIRTLVLIQLS